MKSSQQTIRISISLVALTLFIFLAARWLGIMPDENESRIQKRINIAESLAAMCSIATKDTDLKFFQDVFDVFVKRHQQIQSILLVETRGNVIVKYGDPPPPDESMGSTPNHLKVPIYKNGEVWGVVEVVFPASQETFLSGIIQSSFFQLIIFITVFGFILYMLLIRKVLSHLDPYKIIPARVQKTLDALSEGVVLINNEECIVLTNKAFEKKFGFDIKQKLGKKLSKMNWKLATTNEDTKQILPWNLTLIDGMDYENVKLTYNSSNKDMLTILVNCTPLKDIKGNIKGVLVSLNDITEIEKITQDMEGMSKMLRHEIYNALIGASGTVKLLEKNDRLTDDDKQLLRLTQKSHSVIETLLESMREAKDIESSFTKEEMKSLRIDSLIEEITYSYTNLYHDHDFIFKTDGAELIIRGQEERIIQMLGKLVSNAVDHSDIKTSIIISCEKINDNAFIQIKNQGRPLPDDKDSIFDLYASFRQESSEKKNQGIGLYVVKLIVEMHGGSVEARDRKEVTGAEFIIKIPLV